MKGLLKKEWFVLWNKPIMILIPLILFAVMGITSHNFFMIMYLPLYIGILPVSLITTDETSRWERFALGMPYSRKDLVSAKYLMSLLLVLGGVLLTSAILVFVMNSTLTVPQMILLIAASFAVSLILPSVLLPLNLKFGTARARLALAVLLAIFGCMAAAAFNTEGGDDSFNVIAWLAKLQFSPQILALLFVAAAAVIMAVSWAVSVIIYRRKQF